MVKAGEGKRKERAPELMIRNGCEGHTYSCVKGQSVRIYSVYGKQGGTAINRPSSNKLEGHFLYSGGSSYESPTNPYIRHCNKASQQLNKKEKGDKHHGKR